MSNTEEENLNESLPKSDDYWCDRLTAEQFKVTRKKGTEPAFTGEYWDTKMPGVYQCVCCGLPLFESETKFDSGTGWPSFFAPTGENVAEVQERTLFLGRRTEVLCARCDAHLGHVFPDGPQPTGMRYCVNSASLKLEAKPEHPGADSSGEDASHATPGADPEA